MKHIWNDNLGVKAINDFKVTATDHGSGHLSLVFNQHLPPELEIEIQEEINKVIGTIVIDSNMDLMLNRLAQSRLYKLFTQDVIYLDESLNWILDTDKV